MYVQKDGIRLKPWEKPGNGCFAARFSAFFSGLHGVASPFRVFGLAAGSPPSLRDRACSARIKPYTVFALNSLCNLTEKCAKQFLKTACFFLFMLDARARHLLKTLIERYIAEGQPVGSRTLSKDSELELS